jgi:acyl carrier protein
MEEEEILIKLRELVSDIMEISSETLKSNSKQEDIPEWDSLGHLRLIMALEEEFAVKFPMMEIPQYNSVDALIKEIIKQKNHE